MDCYASIDEKRPFFKNGYDSLFVIDTPNQFAQMIAQLDTFRNNDKLHAVFRGVYEAKFKLFTSLQREWAAKDVGKSGISLMQFVKRSLTHIKHLGPGNRYEHILMRHFCALGIDANDWLLLAFMQHYGAPSPLLDFTRNWQPALFFICLNMPTYDSPAEIDHYSALVAFKAVDVCDKVTPSLSKDLCHKFHARFPVAQPNDDVKRRFFQNELLFENVMATNQVRVIPAYRGVTPIREKVGAKFMVHYSFPIANLNMVSQEGEFVCNISPDVPLEKLFVDARGNYHIYCYNIHKSLRQHIISTYLGGSIEQKAIELFPKEEDIARQIHESTLADLW